MSKTVRVTCTVPAEVLKAADRLAARLDRSRSWVVAEALRRFAAGPPDGGNAAVSEEPVAPYATRGPFRAAEQARLDRDFALTPEQRVRISQEIARAVPDLSAPRQPFRTLQFDTYADYLDWKRFADLKT